MKSCKLKLKLQKETIFPLSRLSTILQPLSQQCRSIMMLLSDKGRQICDGSIEDILYVIKSVCTFSSIQTSRPTSSETQADPHMPLP
jgi:hypothetical protein